MMSKLILIAALSLALGGCMVRIDNCGAWIQPDFPPVGLGCF